MTPAEHVCTETSCPGAARGAGRTYRGHTDRGARARHPRVRTPHLGALARDQLQVARRLPPSVAGLSQFSTVSGPTWSPRTPCGPSSRGGADMQVSTEARQQSLQSGLQCWADLPCTRAGETCGLLWGSQELQLPEGAALRPTTTEAPVPASLKLQLLRRPSVCTLWKEDFSQPLREPEEGGAGAESAEPQKTGVIREAKSGSPQVTQHRGLHATATIKQWKSFVSDDCCSSS